MAVRTTQELVQGIIEADLDTWPDLTPFIEAASQLVDDVCTSSGYSDPKLERIERWLAAHFYAIADPRFLREEVSTSITSIIESKVDLGLDVTRYGQMAKVLDTEGSLAALDNLASGGGNNGGVVKVKQRILWLGSED